MSSSSELITYARATALKKGDVNDGRSVTISSTGPSILTLKPEDSGTIFISTALESSAGAYIHLPAADSTDAVGSYFKIVCEADSLDNVASVGAIRLPNEGSAKFIGVATMVAPIVRDEELSQASSVLTTAGTAEAVLFMPNATNAGGMKASVYEFWYKSTSEVYVFAQIYTSATSPGSSVFNDIGYS